MSDRTDPFAELASVLERLDDAASGGFAAFARTPPVDVLDRDDEFEVRVDLPGVDRSALDLELAGQTLHVRADERDEPSAGTYLQQERDQGAVDRAVDLPDPVDPEDVTASLSDGVLTVRLPKREPEQESLDIDFE